MRVVMTFVDAHPVFARDMGGAAEGGPPGRVHPLAERNQDQGRGCKDQEEAKGCEGELQPSA